MVSPARCLCFFQHFFVDDNIFNASKISEVILDQTSRNQCFRRYVDVTGLQNISSPPYVFMSTISVRPISNQSYLLVEAETPFDSSLSVRENQ